MPYYDSRDDKENARKALKLKPITTSYRGVEIEFNPNSGYPYRAELEGQRILKDDLDKLMISIDDRMATSRQLRKFTALKCGHVDFAEVSVNSITVDFKSVNVSEGSGHSQTRDQVKKSDMNAPGYRRTDLDGLFKDTEENRALLEEISQLHRQINQMRSKIREAGGKLERVIWDDIEAARVKTKKKASAE